MCARSDRRTRSRRLLHQSAVWDDDACAEISPPVKGKSRRASSISSATKFASDGVKGHVVSLESLAPHLAASLAVSAPPGRLPGMCAPTACRRCSADAGLTARRSSAGSSPPRPSPATFAAANDASSRPRPRVVVRAAEATRRCPPYDTTHRRDLLRTKTAARRGMGRDPRADLGAAAFRLLRVRPERAHPRGAVLGERRRRAPPPGPLGPGLGDNIVEVGT